jgi:hypothetical protein
MVSINRFEEVTWLDLTSSLIDLIWSVYTVHDNLVQPLYTVYLWDGYLLLFPFYAIKVVILIYIVIVSKWADTLLYLTFIQWPTWNHCSIILSLSTPSSIGIYIYGEIGQLHHSCSICTTNLPIITTSTSSSIHSSIHSFISIHPFISMNYIIIINIRFDHYYHFYCCCCCMVG